MIFFYVNVILLETFNFLFFQLCKDKVAESIHIYIYVYTNSVLTTICAISYIILWYRFVPNNIKATLVYSDTNYSLLTAALHSLIHCAVCRTKGP